MSSSERLARALKKAKRLAGQTHIIRGNALERADREILVRTGWLQDIIRGWYMLVRPDVATGDTAAWYANFWDFIHLYLTDRFGENYCLSAESSLDCHTEKSTIPTQLIVMAHFGGGLTNLKHDLSLMVYVDEKNFPKRIVQKNKLNIMPLELALCRVAPSYFAHNSREAELALRAVPSASDIVRTLAQHDFQRAANRLAGAYQFLGNADFANEIISDLKKLGLNVTPENPFTKTAPLLSNTRITSPYAGRIRAMWSEARDTVEKHFPKPPGLTNDAKKYLAALENVYQFDAYNSLSIEGYQVSNELIERVKSKKWQPDRSEFDRDMKNAMAAKGYFDTFQLVKKDIGAVLLGKSAAKLISTDLQKWYQALFGPAVLASIIPSEALFGYRNDRVFIRNSMHAPPPKEAVPDAMNAFFDCLKQEPHPGVRAILGHYIFVHIHPYMDGNGRIARFIMNTLLAEGGYPWTVVRVDHRKTYIDTLESTHTHLDLTAFTRFIAKEMRLKPR
jgi:hypothetical protein